MKKLTGILASIIVTIIAGTSAQAQEVVRVAHINLNDCAKAQRQIQNLSKEGIQVVAECSDYYPGGYSGSNGYGYDYRLTTTITFPNHVQSGTEVQLAFIDTNDCSYAQALIGNLNSVNEPVQAVCSDYNPDGFLASNGERYDYRLYTTLTVY